MLSIFDGLRDVTLLSITVRMLLAVICGGIIGIEREYKRRPAGFRTHILICLGAAMTTLTSQYLYLNMHYFTDMARLEMCIRDRSYEYALISLPNNGRFKVSKRCG